VEGVAGELEAVRGSAGGKLGAVRGSASGKLGVVRGSASGKLGVVRGSAGGNGTVVAGFAVSQLYVKSKKIQKTQKKEEKKCKYKTINCFVEYCGIIIRCLLWGGN
jgi:hypothetical protein